MHELIEDAKAVFGEKLLAVILYGSYSRNEQTEDFSKYNEYRTVLPFYRNIDKEGIILWKREKRKSLPFA